MLHVLLPNYVAIVFLKKEVGNIETRQMSKDAKAKYCTQAPLAILEPRDNNLPIPAGKTGYCIPIILKSSLELANQM